MIPAIDLVDSEGTSTTPLKLIVDSEVRGTTLQKLIVDSLSRHHPPSPTLAINFSRERRKVGAQGVFGAKVWNPKPAICELK